MTFTKATFHSNYTLQSKKKKKDNFSISTLTVSYKNSAIFYKRLKVSRSFARPGVAADIPFRSLI